MRPHLASLALLITFALAALPCGGGSSNVTTSSLAPGLEPGGVYLALGDSIAAGEGASDAGQTSYVALVAQALEAELSEAPELVLFAVGGHTTQDLIDQQLAPALGRIGQGNVRLVTITIGGNDLFQYSADPDCVLDPTDPDCPLEAGLIDVERRLDRILGDLRAAGPETAIVIEVYPQLFSGSGHMFERQAETAFNLLNGVITSVARRHGVLVADPRPAFEGRSTKLTHILDEPEDFHPNDAGHRAIAAAFLEVLGLSTDGQPSDE